MVKTVSCTLFIIIQSENHSVPVSYIEWLEFFMVLHLIVISKMSPHWNPGDEGKRGKINMQEVSLVYMN